MQTRLRYCPACAAPLEEAADGAVPYLDCPACDFRYYREPKVSVIARIEDRGRILFVQRGVEPGLGKWCLPGGFLNFGETPEQALGREVLEETGLAVRVGPILGAFPMEGRGPITPGVVLAFTARCVSNPKEALAGDDVVDLSWRGPRQVPHELAFSSTLALIREWQAEQ